MNESEKQLEEFLKFKFAGGFDIFLKLSPQGDQTVICQEAINLCTVTIKDNQYLFGGISERIYMEMYQAYDPRA